jgi:hypothetical protein
LIVLVGPNVATGHASVIAGVEVQISLAIQVMQPVLQGKVKAYEITEKASDEYNDWLQKRMAVSVWSECRSYYLQGMNGKNVVTFPGSMALFWYVARNPVWTHFMSDKGFDNKNHPHSIQA